MSAETSVKGYAPLPQSISTDTEDDEDEHHHHRPHHPHRHRGSADSTSKDDDRSRTSDATTICQNGRFYPLDESKNLSTKTRNGRNSFGYSNDNIPIMILNGQSHDDLWKRQDMSPLKKICLVLSVLLCIATILVFLFVIPCDNSSICPPAPQPKTSISWDRTLEGVEIHGKITVIPSNPYNLIFLLRGQQYGDIDSKRLGGQRTIEKNGGGVLSMQGTSGITLWWVVLKRLPTDINCKLIDTDGSGKPDCLVTGEGGLLVSIEPIAGTIHWNAEVHTYPELPLVLPDLDADRIKDLISVEITNTSHNLVFLSGKTGKLLMRQSISGCESVKLKSVDSSFILTYACYNSNDDAADPMRTILLKNFVDSQSLVQTRRRFALNNAPKIYPNQTSAISWDLTAHYRLYVRNTGSEDCPADSCRSLVDLTLRNGVNESGVWNHTSLGPSFVARPAIVNTTGQPYTAGFALKLWTWNPETLSAAELAKDKLEPEVRQRNLTERVSFVYVNRTEVHVMKPSEQDLVQLCRADDCQPSLPRQARSIWIADLNADGVLELISYGSSYSQAENSSRASLSSRVQIVKLESFF